MTNYHAKTYGWPTTRRYHRTMMNAFQQDQAQWWFPPERTNAEKVWLYVATAFAMLSVLFVLGSA